KPACPPDAARSSSIRRPERILPVPRRWVESAEAKDLNRRRWEAVGHTPAAPAALGWQAQLQHIHRSLPARPLPGPGPRRTRAPARWQASLHDMAWATSETIV